MENNSIEACISVERTVKVWKEDATQACKSIRPEIGLPDLTMEDVSEIWDTLKAEGRVLSFCTDNNFFDSSFIILYFRLYWGAQVFCSKSRQPRLDE